MNVYVAGKTQAFRQVQQIQALVRHTGHTITYDWCAVIEQEGGDVTEVEIPQSRREEYALNDMRGVYECNLLVALGHPHLSGTLWECGMAAAWRKRVWLVQWEYYGRVSIFEDLPGVERVNIQTLGERLWEISAKRLEMDVGPRLIKVYEDGTFDFNA